MMIKIISNHQICENFDTLIIDQWGVLHNGTAPYEGVINALKFFRANNKTIIILSNSGKPAASNINRSSDIGITPDLYDLFMTSGEAVKQGFINRQSEPFSGLGHRAYLISRGNDTAIIDGTDIEAVETIEQADFILLSGFTERQNTVEDYAPLFKQALLKQMPMICANPDLQAVHASGFHPAAGALAAYYETMGGVVYYFGKPYPLVFETCHGLIPFDKKRTLMIGDSLHHDVFGAKNFGIASLLIGQGILCEQLDLNASIEHQLKTVFDIAQKEKIMPDFYAPRL